MTIEDLLKSKVIENPIKRFKKELEEIVNSNLVTKLFSGSKLKKEVAAFGLELLKLQDNYYSNYISLGSKQAETFAALVKDNMWDDQDYYELLVYFFGEENAVYADAGYTGVEKREEHENREVIWQVAARRSTSSGDQTPPLSSPGRAPAAGNQR